MTTSIKIRLLANTLGVVALLVFTWIVAVFSTNELRGSYVHTVQQTDALNAALLEAGKLRDDEETGLRGYLLTRQKGFLEPYTAAQVELGPLGQRITALLVGDPGISSLTVQRIAYAHTWEAWAAGVLKHPLPLGSAQFIAQQERGRALFDRYRFATTRITAALDRERQADLANSLNLLTRVNLIFGVLFAGALALGLFLGWRTIRAVTLPLDALGRSAQAIGNGDLSMPVSVGGAGEFIQLGKNMEWMRAQLADQARLGAEREMALEAGKHELERSNAELQQFAYIASHDLQEPLRTISSYLQLLSRRYQGKPLDESADQFIEFAVDGAKRMQNLIQDLLAYSRVGTMTRDVAPADCAALVTEVVATLHASITEKGALVVHEGLPVVAASPDQLRQVFQNLIGNALKFSPAVPEVRISAQRQVGQWLFTVRDNGIGLDPAHAERIFIIFQRLHTREEYAGTGIGLALCKKIVERHGGRIWVESHPGQGAAFHFTLPASLAGMERAA